MSDLPATENRRDQRCRSQKFSAASLLILFLGISLTVTLFSSPAFATDYFPTSVSVSNGTITSGTYSSVQSVNGTYLIVQETGSFQITYTFTNNIPAIQNSIMFTGRYQGNSTHAVELQIYNYSTSSWTNVRSATKDFGNSSTDYNFAWAIPGTLSNYFTGTAPNLTARIRVNHTSSGTSSHYFYTDMISLSTMADLSIAKTVSSTPAIAGNDLIYTITVSNGGPNGATGLVVTDILPIGMTYVSNDLGAAYNSGTGRWTVGSLAASSSATLNITATPNTGTGGTTKTNAAQVAAVNQYDPDSSPNDSAGDEYGTAASTIYAETLSMSAMTVGDFSGVTLSGSATTDTATMTPFTVTDARGTGAGWNVTVQASQFAEYSGGYVPSGRILSLSSLSMPQPTVAANGTSSPVPAITTGPHIIDSGSAVKIASAAANNGKGVYDFTQDPAGLTLSIPASAYSTSYRSEVTISIVSGP
ncbi:MAG: WxL domain-containing protein [Thermoleophilia bacterium]|nr:WxL domain-containing protein [Thermoleophilia bacterium]